MAAGSDISLSGKVKGWLFIVAFMAAIALVIALALRGVALFF